MDAIRFVLGGVATTGQLTDDQQMLLALAKSFETEAQKLDKAKNFTAACNLKTAADCLRRVIAATL